MSAPTLEDILSQVNLSQFNITSAARDFYTDMMGFFHAIDWTEGWLLVLGAFHLFLWTMTIALRNSHDAQMVLLLLILGAVYGAEYINSFAREHWQEFASQNYFDPRGVFISIMYSAPLLCLALCVLLNALRLASKLLIQVKRKEAQAAARRKKQQ